MITLCPHGIQSRRDCPRCLHAAIVAAQTPPALPYDTELWIVGRPEDVAATAARIGGVATVVHQSRQMTHRGGPRGQVGVHLRIALDAGRSRGAA